jgi:hypothetical protein
MAYRSIKASLPEEVAATLERLGREQGRSIASLIVEAINTRFGAQTPKGQEAAAEAVRRQIGRIEARLDALVAEKAVLKECLLAFIRVWLEHNPPLPEEVAASVAASADARFDRFLDFVVEGLAPGRSVAGDALAVLETQPPERSAP